MITLLYCILFLYLINQYQVIVFDLFRKLELKGPLSAHMFVGIMGYAGLYSITNIAYPKDSMYGVKGYLVPAAICIVVILIYVMIHNIDPELSRRLGLDFLLGKSNKF